MAKTLFWTWVQGGKVDSGGQTVTKKPPLFLFFVRTSTGGKIIANRAGLADRGCWSPLKETLQGKGYGWFQALMAKTDILTVILIGAFSVTPSTDVIGDMVVADPVVRSAGLGPRFGHFGGPNMAFFGLDLASASTGP